MTAPTPNSLIDVAIALVRRGELWLVALRHPHAHLGNQWEFPGGKREPGESPEETALRELREECGVLAAVERELQPRTWDYGDRIVRLTPVLCRWVEGEGRALGCAECRWISAAELRSLPMPEVNRSIIAEIA
ncbi:MAG: 8-oxo-dGTP diphosphatase [Phycisphaerae bacterium]|nr:8-oxo-dGTP diphosphatase [Phycisphaerae bacterium]